MAKSPRARRAAYTHDILDDPTSPPESLAIGRSASELSITYLPIEELKEAPSNARTHSGKQLAQLRRSIEKNGFVTPVLVDEKYVLIAGHGRLLAAEKLKMPTIPAIVLAGLSDMQKRQLAIADNAIATNAGWDLDKLAIELQEFSVLDDFEPLSIGFESAEIDRILFDHEASSDDPADVMPMEEVQEVSRTGDLWLLGRHRLLCGDARDPADFERLMAGDQAAMVSTPE